MSPVLQEFDCLALEAVLAANFDPRELHNRLADLGLAWQVRLPSGAGADLAGDEDEVYAAAHRLIHRVPELGRHLARLLDERWEGHRARLAESEPEWAWTWLEETCRRPGPDLGGVLWAFARDQRPEVRRALRWGLVRLARRSFRRPADGAAALIT